MLKQIPEAVLFEMIEAFFTGSLSHGYGGKIMADEPMRIGKSMFKGKYLFDETDQKELKDKNLEIFDVIANGFNLPTESEDPIVAVNSELVAKCHTQLRKYLRFFVQDQILFDENTLSFEKTFAVFKKLISDLENENNGPIRLTSNDLNETLKAYYPELGSIQFKIPFWEMVATLWVSWITEIYHERRFDIKNHQVVISLTTDMNEFSINGIRQTFYLPEIKETQQRIKPPEQRNIWYEDDVLHFKNKSGGEKTINMVTADSQRKLFNAFWDLWKHGKATNYAFTNDQIFMAYKKTNNMKSIAEVQEEIGNTRLGKIKGNIVQKFERNGLKEQLTWDYLKKSKKYYFNLKPLI